MNELQPGGIEVLVPSTEAAPTVGRIAPRLTTLDGKVIGFLWNAKSHGDEIFGLIMDNLKEKYQIKDTVVARKQYFGNLAPKEILDKLAESCDAVVTGIGD